MNNELTHPAWKYALSTVVIAATSVFAVWQEKYILMVASVVAAIVLVVDYVVARTENA
ncbi:hypothetical protein [Natrinema sp. DC36]|uniref:hypothetical protein n=1 Tax=Natrinema sp. DC36 TaxID=2878680 RepID=UPI001CEFCBE6|nr:hypothetical protein [Natrinema sp. DC36]